MSTIQIALLTLAVMLLLGMPIFMTLVIAATVSLLFGASGLPLSLVHNALFEGINIFTPYRALWSQARSWSTAISPTRSST